MIVAFIESHTFALLSWPGLAPRWPGLAKLAMKAYAFLTPLFIGIFLRWEFCSNGTIFMCIIIESHSVLHLELWSRYIFCCFMLLTYCDRYHLKVVS